MPIQLWALEKYQNAYVYLLRQNKLEWGGKVHIVKTDMREWVIWYLNEKRFVHNGIPTPASTLVTVLLFETKDSRHEDPP